MSAAVMFPAAIFSGLFTASSSSTRALSRRGDSGRENIAAGCPAQTPERSSRDLQPFHLAGRAPVEHQLAERRPAMAIAAEQAPFGVGVALVVEIARRAFELEGREVHLDLAEMLHIRILRFLRRLDPGRAALEHFGDDVCDMLALPPELLG